MKYAIYYLFIIEKSLNISCFKEDLNKLFWYFDFSNTYRTNDFLI